MVVKRYPFLHIDYAFLCKRETELVNFVRIILLTLWGKLQYNPHQWGYMLYLSYKWSMTVTLHSNRYLLECRKSKR